jgi:hypothetical protein
MATYMVRDRATKFLKQQGVPVGETQLAGLARGGEGPRYYIINGRALYTENDLLDWIKQQAARSPPEATKRGLKSRKRARRAA